MKKFLSLILVALLAFPSAAAFAESVSPRVLPLEGYNVVEVPTDVISYDSEVVMTYIQEFANLSQVPRASYKTEKVTEYVKAWATNHGLEAESDEAGNVVVFIPATEGYENVPLTLVQGHIDMVAAADEGVVHDWENDPLDLIWSANSVTADGTTLGADNGTGVAFMFTYIDYLDTYTHGPLRFIFTVDEEVGLLGAHELDAKYVEDALYLINVDGGYGGATVSAAGGKYFHLSHAAEWVAAPEGSVTYAVEFKDLKGGHSASVGGGKANGLVATANALLSLKEAGIDFNLINLVGGSAPNAIPNGGKAEILLAEADVEAATTALDAFAKLFKDSYEAVETNYTLTYGVTDTVAEKALDADLSVKFAQVLSLIPNNIHTLRPSIGGTEASSNVGIVSVGEDVIEFTSFMRSSSTYQSEQLTLIASNIAELAGFNFDVPLYVASWPMKAENKLADIASQVYLELTGEEYRISATHGGLEGGEFAEKNENLHIISTGVSGGSAAHTTAEKMNFDKVEVSVEFLVTLIERLAQAE